MNASNSGSSPASCSEVGPRLAIGLVLMASLGTSCGRALPPVTPELVSAASARWTGMDAARLEASRSLYVQRCSTCHGLYGPEACSESRWPAVMAEMARKARLDEGQREELLRFILAA